MYKYYIHVSKDDEKDFIAFEVREIATNKKVAIDSKEVLDEAWASNKLVDYSYVMNILRIVTGRTLTVIDGVVPQGKQNKAVKDMVRQIISETMETLSEQTVDQREVQNALDNISEEELDSLESVDVFEVIGIEEKE